MNASTLIGYIYAVVKVAMLIGIFYFAVVEVLRERRKR
jgi:hypothetical protein